MNIVYNEPPATSEPVEVVPGGPSAGLSGAALIWVSWRAIFAGLVLVLAIEILLYTLGLGVGLNFVRPGASGTGFGIGEGIWWMVSTIIALLFGSYAAARLAGVASRWDGVLHGLVIWGGAVLIAAYLLTSVITGLLGGAFSVLGGAVSVLPQIARTAEANPTVQANINSQQGQKRVDNALAQLNNAKNQAGQTARQTAGVAAATASELALLAFAAMVIGLISAGVGGALALPRPRVPARSYSRPVDRV